MIKTFSLCPYSSLSVEKDDENFARRITYRYKYHFVLLGGAITYSRPEGHADEKSLERALKKDTALIETILTGREKFVQIEDYRALESSTLKARMAFADFVSRNSRCAGVIFCNLTLPFRTAVKLGMPQRKYPCPILIASDYHQAVDWAQEICEREDIPLDYGRIPFSYKPDSPSLTTMDLSFLTYPGEDFPLPLSYLINDRILYFSFPEEIDRDLVDRLEREGEELMTAKSGQRFSAAECLLVECSLMKRISAPVRKYAARRFRSIINPDKKPNVYLFNQTNKGAAIIRLISPLLPLHLTLVKSVEEAVDRALGNRDRTGKSQQENGTACEGELLSVINLLSEIRWDQRGTHLTPDRDNASMNILIEAVKLIKEELDGLLEEKENSYSRLEDTIESLREIRTIDIPLKELRDYLISLAQSPRLRQEDRAYLASMDERVMKTLDIIHRQPSLPGERENIFLT